MDLANIIIISFILFLLILAPSFAKRVYDRRRCEKLLREYRDNYKQYNEVDSEEKEALPDNVVNLEAYRERKI